MAKRIATVQTPGGCGALRVGAEFIKRCRPDTTVWVSDPTWPNHGPLLGDTGLQLKSYPYYDSATHGVNFDKMIACLESVPATDVVLLHACCHNPSGADLSQEQWQALTKIAHSKGFTVFIDSAYQGFGLGLEDDAYGVRLMAESLPELIVASSCSKNFGLYRERTGTLCIMTENQQQAPAVQTHLNKIVRGIYSMPPAHGAAIVETLLGDDALRQQWQQELVDVRGRILGLRKSLADSLQQRLDNDDFRFVERQVGMFSFLGLNPEQVKKLREEYSIYMAGDSRINVAGLKAGNVDYVADAITAVL
jgi:aspartate aminotransferase